MALAGEYKNKALGEFRRTDEGEIEAARAYDDGVIKYRRLDPTDPDPKVRKQFNFPEEAAVRMLAAPADQ